jgi:DNA polymerase-1
MTQATAGPKTLLLIDANSLIHRFFHALPPLTTPKGEPCGALYGLSQVLLKIFREIRPTHIAAAFDRPEPTFRDELFKDYKAHRPPTADELIAQLQRSHDVFDVFGAKTFEIPGFEADDIIGTLVERFRGEPDVAVAVFSGDLDTLQLVQHDKVVVEFLLKGITETKRYNEAAVVERYGLSPSQLPDYKGFVGDASDNIPGVKGVGPKTILPLLQKYGSVEGVFSALPQLTDRERKKLEGHEEEALLSKKLGTIHRNAPLYFDTIDELRAAPLDMTKLSAFFMEFGFQSLAKRVEQVRLL